MKKEILFHTLELDSIIDVFGFGSFFRKESYNDIDVLIVVRNDVDSLLVLYKLEDIFYEFEKRHNVKMHFSVFSEKEMESKPIKNICVSLYQTGV